MNTQETQDQAIEFSSPTSPVGQLRQFVRTHLVETVVATIVGSAVVTGISAWNVWSTYQGFQDTVTQEFELQKQADKIVYVDEVLTMSARLAASTGSLTWEDRYNKFVPELDAAIEAVLSNVTDEIRAEASQTDAANQALIAMETEAFELNRAGKSQQALALLLGPEYLKQKTVYTEGNKKVLASVDEYIQDKIDGYRSQLQGSIGFAAGTFPILLAAWILVLSAVRDYIRDRVEAQAFLRQSQSELAATNHELIQAAKARENQDAQIKAESEQLQQDIGELLDVVCDIEEGDLTVQAKVNDRATGLVSDTLNRLVESLGGILQQVDGTTREVSRSGQRQRRIASMVANSTEQQTKAVNKALELTTTVREAAKSAAVQLETTKLSLLTLQDTVVNGQTTMQDLSSDIGVLQQGSDRIVQQMKTLGEFVGLTDQFVHDQGEIAAETQVLALNASLVAARAAEQRDPQQFARVARDFELIATQVSQLAQQTNAGLSTLEQRSTQIHQVVSDIDANVQNLGDLVEDFNRGVQQTDTVFHTVQQVTGQAVEAGDVVAQTNQSIVESAENSTQRMEAIADFSQQIAQQSQHAQQLSEAMNALSTDLLSKVEVFKLPSELSEALSDESVEPSTDEAEPSPVEASL
ncbi:MAG: methyl-accepting chemotaxis protein [Thermosynechococcaceae cyanobacterium]